jgi:hypothetical protein
MGGRSGRGSRSPIRYASVYQNSFSHAEITVHRLTTFLIGRTTYAVLGGGVVEIGIGALD